MVTVIGHITADELRRYLTRTEIGNGFANRFLFAMARRSKELPFGGGALDLTSLAVAVEDRIARVAHAGERRIGWTDGAKKIWVGAYHDLSEGKPGMVGAVTSRAEAQVLRIALIYALLDGSAFLGPEHLAAGLAIWSYCQQSAVYLFGDTTGDPVADEIRRALDGALDGLSRLDISNMFGRHRSAAEIGHALGTLLERGMVRCEKRQTRGRPEERWYADKA